MKAFAAVKRVIASAAASRSARRPAGRFEAVPGRRPEALTFVGYLRLFVLFACLSGLLVLAAGQGLATSYQRGNFLCGNFERAERLHKIDPDSRDYQMGYAECLLYRGDDDFDALNIMRYLADERGLVVAAYEIAQYVTTGGTLTDDIVFDNVNEAIEAWHKVLFMINSNPRYPNATGTNDRGDNIGEKVYEMYDQIELTSHYSLIFLLHNKFMNGAEGTHNARLLQSPSYEGDRDLNTYPEYSPYTLDSLDKVIEQGSRCRDLPKKKHFNTIHYKVFTEACRRYAELARTLKPLESRRLTILEKESCQDLNKTNCPEYFEVLEEKIMGFVNQHSKAMKEVLRPWIEYKNQ